MKHYFILLKTKTDSTASKKAVQIIKKGGILVFPTDTVYGIGCNPYDKTAVEKIYKIKNRPIEKSLPILTGSLENASEIVEFDKNSRKLAEKFWPGPLTLILKIKDKKIEQSMNLNGKIAIRVPRNNWLLEVLKEVKVIIGTSANISGQNSFVDPKKCSKKLEYDLFIDGGKIESSGESTIIEFKGEEMLMHREGVLTREEILEVL